MSYTPLVAILRSIHLQPSQLIPITKHLSSSSFRLQSGNCPAGFPGYILCGVYVFQIHNPSSTHCNLVHLSLFFHMVNFFFSNVSPKFYNLSLYMNFPIKVFATYLTTYRVFFSRVQSPTLFTVRF